jgi:DNA integrity scanning protein DisA with diadenylate cyclase activity
MPIPHVFWFAHADVQIVPMNSSPLFYAGFEHRNASMAPTKTAAQPVVFVHLILIRSASFLQIYLGHPQ